MKHSLAAFMVLTSGYLAYRYLILPGFLRKVSPPDPHDNSYEKYWQRIISAFFYGVVPLVIISLSDLEFQSFGFQLTRPLITILSGMGIGVILIFVNLLNYRNTDNLLAHPQIRCKYWNTQNLILSAVTWMLYLLAYESLFRGYLLFSLFESTGKWPAIAINIALYSLVHIHAGWKETVGAIPLGFVLCIVCLETGNFWAAFIAHVFLALSNEWLSLYAHPEITFTKNMNGKIMSDEK